MPIIGALLKKGIGLRTTLQKTINKRRRRPSPVQLRLQKKTLFQIIAQRQSTPSFGKNYDFTSYHHRP